MMTGYQRMTWVAMGVVLATGGSARAAEKTITRAELPPAVQRTVATESRGATVKGFTTEVEGGQRVYEAEFVVDGHGKDVSIDEHGRIVEVEEEVALASLPGTVQAGLKKAAGPGKINKVESLTKHGTLVAYEAVVRTGGKRIEVQVGPEGRPLTHPE